MSDLREIAEQAIRSEIELVRGRGYMADDYIDGFSYAADAVIAAIEPVLRTRHRAELLGELKAIFAIDPSADWGVDDLHAVLTEEAIQEVKAVFAQQEAEDDR